MHELQKVWDAMQGKFRGSFFALSSTCNAV